MDKLTVKHNYKLEIYSYCITCPDDTKLFENPLAHSASLELDLGWCQD